MSLVPDEQSEIIASRSDMKPRDPKDARNWWERFVDILRQHVGLKPLHLSERWAEAEIRAKEVANELALLQGKLDYEATMAEIERQRKQTDHEHAQGKAKANLTNADARIKRAVARHLEQATNDPEAAMDRLNEAIQQIANRGGVVEIDLPGLTDEGDEDL